MSKFLKNLLHELNMTRPFRCVASSTCDDKLIIAYNNTLYKVTFEEIGQSPYDLIIDDMHSEAENLR